ncbi:hypothetical protein T265_08926 [Opisthorchis viverrini]|uniref:Uncharacterized protein n=1 Tax=Opisthorchis viverrini TaxID=6198 RepID=A0A074Z7P3_OPIVI|nr:hypothetical protein T265_08926 [Opisthorchis viverrini]KER23118.1 hypothetical protein T265_08926 [Opisthorchis viverrini]
MTSVFNTDASLPYNHDLFESLIVKRIKDTKRPLSVMMIPEILLHCEETTDAHSVLAEGNFIPHTMIGQLVRAQWVTVVRKPLHHGKVQSVRDKNGHLHQAIYSWLVKHIEGHPNRIHPRR